MITEILNAQVITASGNSGPIDLSSHGSVAQNAEISIELEITAVSGTTPSAQFSVLWSDDGTNWASFPDDIGGAQTAVGNVIATIPVRGGLMQLAWTVTGTTPSFTVSAYSNL